MKKSIFCSVCFQILTIFYTTMSFVAGQLGEGPPQSLWPEGTNATGSSTHDHVSDGDSYRTFYALNAIDGLVDTFWNDGTMGAYPDILTIDIPSTIILNGIILLSTDGGWPSNYTVETNDGSGWILRINVTKDQKNNKDEYSRISEVYPIIISSSSSISNSTIWNPSNLISSAVVSSALASRTSVSPPTAPLPSKSADPSIMCEQLNTKAIAGGFGGGVAIIVVALVVAVSLLKRRRKENEVSIDSPTRIDIQPQAPIELMTEPIELQSRRFDRPVEASYDKPEFTDSPAF